MRRASHMRAQEEDALDLTPMLDVVFIMLIFFIVTAVFVRDPGVEVARPEAVTAVDLRNLAALVAIDEASRIWIDKREVEVAQVRALIERLRAENPKGPVVVQADGRARTGIAAAVLDEVRAAGAPVISVATARD